MGRVSKFLRENLLALVAIVLALNVGAFAVAKDSEDGDGATSADAAEKREPAVQGDCRPAKAIKRIGDEGGVQCTDPLQDRITGSCADPTAISDINKDGTLQCRQFVTEVTAGSGLTGGTITDSGTIATDPTATQSRVGSSCTGNQSIQSVNQNGSVGCSPNMVPQSAMPGDPIVLGAGESRTMFGYGGIQVIVRCVDDTTDRAVVEIGAGGIGVAFVNYWVRTSSLASATVANGDTDVVVDTTDLEQLVFNTVSSSSHQLDGSLGIAGAAVVGPGTCLITGSAVAHGLGAITKRSAQPLPQLEPQP